ncbi:MAG: GTPase/DUF3482 domain-containing protein [Verrucomicrobiota bacterium]
MTDKPVPAFAVVGHPNEGKSSVVSTLTENDRIRISPTPGETVKSNVYPVDVDGQEIMRFVDTPGFQHPRKVLAWFEAYEGPDNNLVAAFAEAHRSDPVFSHEVQLMTPLIDGAGLIYVVDGSRPVRSDDRAEMEILRRTGLPRLAIVNSKNDNRDFTEDWKNAFRRHFNSIRVFNAHRASYAERLSLLQTLRGIDQDWEPALNRVIETFTLDWSRRIEETTALITDHMERVIQHQTVNTVFNRPTDNDRDDVLKTYQDHIVTEEQDIFRRLRKLYRHRRFKENLPADSILNQPIFCKETAQVLGLTGKQFTMALAALGAGGGLAIDAATAGIAFGVFTASGAAIGATSAFIYGRQLARVEVSGPLKLPGRSRKKLGGIKLTVGPNRNPQFFYVLLDRCLLYYQHLVNWTHARRDTVTPEDLATETKIGFVSGWSDEQRKTADEFFKALHKGSLQKQDEAAARFGDLLKEVLQDLSNGETPRP